MLFCEEIEFGKELNWQVIEQGKGQGWGNETNKRTTAKCLCSKGSYCKPVQTRGKGRWKVSSKLVAPCKSLSLALYQTAMTMLNTGIASVFPDNAVRTVPHNYRLLAGKRDELPDFVDLHRQSFVPPSIPATTLDSVRSYMQLRTVVSMIVLLECPFAYDCRITTLHSCR